MISDEQRDRFSQYDDLPTNDLETLLRNDLKGSNHPALSTAEILHICQILAQRKPVKTDAKSAWKAFLEQYISDGR